MGKYKDKNGTSLIGDLLRKSAPHIIDMVGDAFPPAKLLTQLIDTDPQIKPEDKLEFHKLMTDEEERKRFYELENNKSARDMQVAALNQDDLFSKRFVYYLAMFWSLLAGAFIFTVIFIDIPDNSIRIVDTVLGFLLGTIIAAIINYFFGSSKGSADKNILFNKK